MVLAIFIILSIIAIIAIILTNLFWVKQNQHQQTYYEYLIYILFNIINISLISLYFGKRLINKPFIRKFQSDTTVNHSQYDLSKREMEIIQLIKQGFSNKEIAEKLGIAENTVKSFLYKLFLKLDVKNRTGLISKTDTWKNG